MSDRKIKILEAIINDYIASAEPVGSRTIAKKHGFGLSPATIRNEMSDLEEMGYVTAPHTSSGRIPSDKGYRLYVDSVMKKRNLSQEAQEMLANALAHEVTQVGSVMKEIARAVSAITKYTAVATEPVTSQHKIKFIQMLVIDGPVALLMIVTETNVVKNHVVVLPKPIKPTGATKISQILTNILHGSLAHEITGLYAGAVRHKFRQENLDEGMVEPLLSAVLTALMPMAAAQIYTSGLKNILHFPEFADLEKARAIFAALEEREALLSLLEGDPDCNQIRITIGNENKNLLLRDCSIIRAKISINNHFYGNIAIIGPTRMDYAQVMSVLQTALGMMWVQ